MKTCYSILFYYFVLFILSHYGTSEAKTALSNDNVYIVYMGANKNSYDTLLSSLISRNQSSLIHTYKHGFSGFAARLSESEALQLSKQPGVVSVFPDPLLQLHTTRSWDFLQYGTSPRIASQSSHSNAAVSPTEGSDTIIGFLDSGIWPESESFSDKGLGPIPRRWRGICMEGKNFSSSNCNKKIIGARHYSKSIMASPRDDFGHGTHVASTAAGAPVANASYYGLANGTARGGSPTSRIASYRVCSNEEGCPGSAILAAFDDAIADGVDMLSLSLGTGSSFENDFATDAIAIGAFHAVQKGITVVCSAGNGGPSPQSVVNVAPWIFTVAATTIDRDFESDVILGNNTRIKGGSINFSKLIKSPVYPLISGGSAKNKSASEYEARNCYPDAIDAEKIRGKIVLCQQADNSDYDMYWKQKKVNESGAVGLIIVSDLMRLFAIKTGDFPMTVITSKDSNQILAYINATKNPVATILPTKTAQGFKPAPTVAFFSSRGPSSTTLNILKPDIAAPGVNILAAWKGNDTLDETTPEGREPSLFNVISGTSMACPHVTGIAANIKAQNPAWTPAAIRSAIMTTATQTNNINRPITTQSFDEATTPYDLGAGEVNPIGGLHPGLIYDIEPAEYLNFLCYYGYNMSTIKLIAGDLPIGFSCPVSSNTDMISNINYPSIAISMIDTIGPIIVNRTVTNVDTDDDPVYNVTVETPTGLEVDVSPTELRFTAATKKLEYMVTFSTSDSSVKGDLFGAITWRSNKFIVRSPFVVSRSGA
ncbi:CO(2)-response secreted protease-like [Chenopodium quinoa]|uniref:Uncharacterized protein n=1 Tax=Chenopodium quinoa TaxID=63459 RepID=A0A803LSS8_CHEQI|nr:CO(2)-response secreted protease-like [Chenopodium quinoa]